MSLDNIELQIASSAKLLPKLSEFKSWIQTTITQATMNCDRTIRLGGITVRIVDKKEMIALNFAYRKKNAPTNVLSFLYDPLSGLQMDFTGDIIICAPVVESEAQAKQLLPLAHWAHMTVHGTLHLLGHDHEIDTEATIMESMEIHILKFLGFENPYSHTDGENTTTL